MDCYRSYLCSIGCSPYGLRHIGLFSSFTEGAAGEVTVLAALYPAITLILSYIFLHEEISLKKVGGLCLALVSIYLLKK